jgi:hypothetical protein
MQRTEIRWQAPEFEYREKDVSWYWLTIIFALFALAVAVWQRNLLFALFVVIAEILIITWGNRKPRIVDFAINETGVTVFSRTLYPYKEMESFSVEEPGEQWTTITFKFQRKLKMPLRVTVPKEKIADITKRITEILPQTEPEESFIDDLEKFFRF